MTTETITKRQEKIDRQEVVNDIIAVMNLPQGRRYVWRLLENAGIFRTPYKGSTNDTMVRIGEHSFGVQIMNDIIEANPDLYLLMQKEHYIQEAPDKPAEEKAND